jgi:translocation and assembly module TamB
MPPRTLQQNRYDLNAALSGAGNDLTARGHIINSPTRGSIDLTADIASLSMKTAEAFSAGQITETAGTLSGSAKIRGPFSDTGGDRRAAFQRGLSQAVGIEQQASDRRRDGAVAVRRTLFRLLHGHRSQQPVGHHQRLREDAGVQGYCPGLQLQADDFLLMNTTVRDNETVFGRMVIDSDISIGGPLDLPVVRGRLKLKEGSHATFVVPESRLTTDRGENVVLFEGPEELHPILEEGTTVV